MTIHVSQDMISSVTDPITGELAHIHRFTLVNDVTNMYVQVISYGAAIFSLRIPDESGKLEDVVMGFDLIEEYEDCGNPYFGATVGRVCNRLSYGSFFIYDKEVQVTQNHGIHHLHGGNIGFDKIPWNLKEIHENGVTFCHRSPDGHEGYPGELFCTVRYTIHEDNTLRVYMTAKTTMTTIVNMTNHSYFNLAGHDAGRDALYQHTVSIFAREITQTNDECIPTGVYLPVIHTPYDFRCGENLGRRIRKIEDRKLGFDDNFCVTRDELGPKDITRVAKVIHQPTGRWMEVYSNQPGVQFYTGNFLPDERKGEKLLKGRDRTTYQKHGAFCLETQGYPDAPNHVHFPRIMLRPGELYEHWVNYKFGTLRNKAPITRLSELDDIEYIDVSIGEGNAENIDDDVYEDMPADAESTTKTTVEQTEKPQSSGAIKKQEKKETSEVKKEAATTAAAAVKAAVKPAEKAKTVAKGRIEVAVTVEKEPKEELTKEPKKYKVDAEECVGAAAVAAGAAAEGEAEEGDEELQGACGGEPKKTTKK
ncbi:galactose mutarotase [Zeugodacus cucurbitae]|uniref:galactose mutarotase n=1 Tax=Zeugodacus cucurbitae TaxID=28588 RepID=UPI0005969410|nr:galactose mutarotase [Zeugodacus cucurbitae]